MSKISAGTTQLTSLKFEGDTTGELELGSGSGTAISIDTSQNVALTNALPIGSGGTGETTANDALNALLPPQTGNAGKVLTTDGTDTSWTSDAGGTVTSVDVSGGTTGLTTSGGPVTTSGTITLDGTLNIANGGTGETDATSAFNALAPAQTGNTGKYLTTDGTDASWALPSVSDVTGILPIANGGTGEATYDAAFNALAPAQAGNTGKFLKTDGINPSWDAVDLTDEVTGVLAIGLGGTGQTTANDAFNALAPAQLGNANKFLTTDGTDTSWQIVDALPSQTGNAGKFLTTDGTDTSWGVVDIESVTGVLDITNGGTGANSASGALSTLGAAASGANTDITSVALTTGTISTTPASSTDIVNKSYVDGIVASGVNYHTPVLVESPDSAGNLNATYDNGVAGVGATLTNAGAQAALQIDGVAVSVADRVLIYNQTTAYENGVYVVTDTGSGSTDWVLTRATDANSYGPGPNALDEGSAFFVQSGNTGAGETYVCSTVGPITFGTTAITFAQIASTQVYSAGDGLTLTNTQFSVTPTGTAGTYGSASQVPVFVTNARGQVTSVTDTSIAVDAAAITSGTLGVSRGGTGASTLTGYVYGNGTGAMTASTSIPNAATTATSANTASAIVARDGSGNFSAGTITASLSGAASNVVVSSTNTNTAYQVPFATTAGTSGALAVDSDSTFTYNPSTNTLSVTTVSGNLTGNALTASSASVLSPGRLINGVGFNGSSDITVTANTTNTLTRGSYLTGSNFNGSAATTWAVDATSANTADKVVARDSSGNFSAGTITADLTGNASGVNVTSSGTNLAYVVPFTGNTTGATGTAALLVDSGASLTYNPSSNTLVSGTFSGNFYSQGTADFRGPGNLNSNVAVGNSAFVSNTSGGGNIAIGNSALAANTTGGSNVAIGFEAATVFANNTASSTVVGYQAGKYAKASYNTALGFQALLGSVSTTTASTANVAIGYQAGLVVTTGSANVMIGYQTGDAINTGGSNALVGYQAGTAITSGSANVAIGYLSSSNLQTGSTNTTIGTQAGNGLTSGSTNICIGYTAGSSITTGSHNVFIGGYAGSAALSSHVALSTGNGTVVRQYTGGGASIVRAVFGQPPAGYTFTGADLISNSYWQYTGAAGAWTFPTAANFNTAFPTVASVSYASYVFTVLNTGSGTLTITPGTSMASQGPMTVSTNTAATFLISNVGGGTITVFRTA